MDGRGGYIKLHRKFLDWGWYPDINTKTVFIHLLLAANFKDTEFMGQVIKAGQAVVSLDSLSRDLCLSVKQVRTALAHLEKTGDIKKQSTKRFTIVTIANWELYQVDKGQSKGNVRADKGQSKGKEGKEWQNGECSQNQ